jgi:cyanophycin synthetase
VDARTITLLERQELTLDAIPAPGQEVQLRQLSSRHQGETADRTDDAHPDNLAIFRQVAGVLGVDVVSMDVVAEDITRSMWTTSGAIIDVNVGSAIFNEVQPSAHRARDPGTAIVDMLFPPGQPVRAPIIAVAGPTESVSATSDLIAHLLAEAGHSVGLSSETGLFIAGTRIRANNVGDPNAVRTLLANPAAEIVVAQVDPLGIVEQGLGFTYCDVVVVLALSGLLRPSGQPVETVLTGLCDPSTMLVLTADDPAVVSLAADFDGPVILISRDARSERVRDHVAQGGRAVVLRRSPSGDDVVLLTADRVTDILSTLETPTWDDLKPDAILAAIAASIARDIPIATIRDATRSFRPRHV